MQFSDLSSTSFYENPYPLYDEIRVAGPFVPIGHNVLISGRHAIIDALLHDRRMGKNYLESVRVRYGKGGACEPVFQGVSRMFLMLNPPTHTRLRGAMMKAFNARQIEAMRDVVQRTADRLISAFAGKDTVDLVREFALPLPVEIICSLLEVPVEHAEMLGDETSQFVRVFDAAPLVPVQLDLANEAYQTLERCFRALVGERRKQRGNDLISLLLSIEEGGEALSDDEVVSDVILLFVAGHETTSNMIGNALIALHRHPQQLSLLKNDASRLPNAIAECMRYDSAVQMVTRIAMEDIEIDGFAVPRDTVVILALGAANRDPAWFDHPNHLIIDRDQVRLQSFGGGIHYCLGARLAMLELETAIGTLFSRFPKLRLLNLDNLQWHPRGNLRGVGSLIAAW